MLELTAAALAPHLAAATNEYLLSVKTWPQFGQARQQTRLRESFAVERQIAEAEAVGGALQPELARRAFRATDLQALKDEFLQRQVAGLRVGQYFYEAIEGSLTGARFTVAELKQRQVRPEIRRALPAFKIGASTFRDLEREFRPAAHLWAAHAWMNFDLVPPDIAEYLAISEVIADQLLSVHIKQYGPLLPRGTKLWRVPASLRALLPPVPIAVEQVPPGSKLLELLR